jgi:hypothetical protein
MGEAPSRYDPRNSERVDVIMPSATSGGACAGGGALAYGFYPADAQSLIIADLARLGPYADGSKGTERVVFVASPQENRSVLTPLERLGFVLHPGMFSACSSGGVRVECPVRAESPTVPAGAPGATAVPPSTSTARPENGLSAAEERFLSALAAVGITPSSARSTRRT